MRSKHLAALAAIALALVSGIALSACGGNDDDSSDSASSGESTDGAFIVDMTAHHQAAIDMAEIASDRAEHPEVGELAESIISSQGSEIEQLDEINQRLFDEPVDVAAADPAMAMDEADLATLESAKPFDREFIDMMVPHHQTAIMMARTEMAEGEDEELMAIASDIIEAQTTEIEEMNAWRLKWYGAESPAGGVPAVGEMAPSSSGDGTMEGMGM